MNNELYHSWGTSATQKAKERAYNHQYYEQHKRDKWGVGLGRAYQKKVNEARAAYFDARNKHNYRGKTRASSIAAEREDEYYRNRNARVVDQLNRSRNEQAAYDAARAAESTELKRAQRLYTSKKNRKLLDQQAVRDSVRQQNINVSNAQEIRGKNVQYKKNRAAVKLNNLNASLAQDEAAKSRNASRSTRKKITRAKKKLSKAVKSAASNWKSGASSIANTASKAVDFIGWAMYDTYFNR